MQEGEQGHKEREKESQVTPLEHRALHQAGSQDPEITTPAEIKSQMPNRLSYPGGPKVKDTFTTLLASLGSHLTIPSLNIP